MNNNTDNRIHIGFIDDIRSGKYGNYLMMYSMENMNSFYLIINSDEYTFIYNKIQKINSTKFDLLRALQGQNVIIEQDENTISAIEKHFPDSLWKIGTLHCGWRDIDQIRFRKVDIPSINNPSCNQTTS